jgi:two-component system cell cycle response regulator
MTRTAEGPQGPAVLMLDIDYFKRVNDTYGHAAGDAVLREVAGRVARHVRGFDLVARYGGEEFVVVMPETDLAVASMVAERLRSIVAAKPAPLGDGTEHAVTISIGIAAARGVSDSATALLERADKALHEAKGRGRNCVAGSESEILPVARNPEIV